MEATAGATANGRGRDSVFPALLRYWRQQRGMSQLDLGLTAEVSARHVSFLESGRSQPSIEMVSLLAETLDVPLRDRNELLRGAGYPPAYPEPGLDELLDGPLGVAVDTMLAQHDPYPMMFFDRLYRVVRSNAGGATLLALAGADEPVGTNIMQVLFEDGPRAMISNWEEVAGDVLRRIHREVMQRPNDEQLGALMADLVSRPGIPAEWRRPDLTTTSDPMIAMRVEIGDDRLALLATITAFNAPSNVTLEELRIESYLPLDDATRGFFERLAVGS